MSKSSDSHKERPALRLVKFSMPKDSKPSPSGSRSQMRKRIREISLDWPVPWESPLPPSESGNETPECSEESERKPSNSEPT